MARRGGLLRLLLILALIALVIYIVLTRYVFVVQSVEVVMPYNVRYTQMDVGILSGIRQGQLMEKIDEKRIAKALTDTGWLELQGVEKVYPNRVVLHINAREPAALVSYLGTLLVTDENGVVLEQLNTVPDYPNCLYVTNLNVSFQRAGQPLRCVSETQQEAFLTLVQTIRAENSVGVVDTIDMTNPRELLIYSTNGVRVELGDSSRMVSKVRWMKAVVEDLIARNENFGTLDVTNATHADYIPKS